MFELTKERSILSKLKYGRIDEGKHSIGLEDYLIVKLESTGYAKRGGTWTYTKSLDGGPILMIRWDVDSSKSRDKGIRIDFTVGIDGHPMFKDWVYETEYLLSKSDIDMVFEQATRSFQEYMKTVRF